MNNGQLTIKEAAALLKEQGIENAVQEAGWLFEHVFKNKEQASFEELKRFNNLVARRADGEPLQYLLGEWEFYGYPIYVGEGVLIPRPETELLVDIGKRHLAMRKGRTEEAGNLTLIDLCTGTGCVGIAMCRELGCHAFGVELSEKALFYAERNIRLNGLEEQIKLIGGDIFAPELIAAMPGADFIFANPPYLSSRDMRELQKEVRFEPASALFGGEDGLDFYRKIFKMWKPKLKEAGLFAVEIGYGQAEAVMGFMEEAGFAPLVMRDYAGIDRVIYAEKTDE